MYMDVGVFATDPLLLNEVMDAINSHFPSFSVTVYSESPKMEDLQALNSQCEVRDIKRSSEEDVLIILNSLRENGILKDFDGSLIDITGEFDAEDTIFIKNPVEYILSSVSDDFNDLYGVCSLPAAIFGKAAVDDLVNQTRHLFSFNSYENKMLTSDLAFNVLLNENTLLKEFKEKLNENIRENFNFRLLPVTTGIIVDVCGAADEILDDDLYLRNFSLSEITLNEGLSFSRHGKGMLSVYGDYLFIYTKQIIDELRKL